MYLTKRFGQPNRQPSKLAVSLMSCFSFALVPRCVGQVGPTSQAVPNTQTTNWAFEVAAIRPVDPAAALAALDAGKVPHIGTLINAHRVDMGSTDLMTLICMAYSVRPDQVAGPGWLASQRFDVEATMPEGATEKQIPEMVRRLLEGRFKLALHQEQKMQSVYALVIGPRGHRLEPPIPDDQFLNAESSAKAGRPQVGGGAGRMAAIVTKEPVGPKKVSLENGVSQIEYARISTELLAQSFATLLRRPVTDMTGLQGTFHVTLTLDQRDLNAGQAAMPAISDSNEAHNGQGILADPSGSVFRAVDSLGLKLESRKVPIEYLVIDHVEKLPTPN